MRSLLFETPNKPGEHAGSILSLDEQMDVIRHDAIGMNPEALLGSAFLQVRDQPVRIFGLRKYVATTVCANGHEDPTRAHIIRKRQADCLAFEFHVRARILAANRIRCVASSFSWTCVQEKWRAKARRYKCLTDSSSGRGRACPRLPA